jgi:acetyl esterase/lipase
MMLWDDEMEALRPVIEREARQFIDFFLGNRREPNAAHATTAERVARQRAGMEAMTFPSELGSDRTIAGPGGPLRLRVFRPDGVSRAAMLHIHGGGWVVGRAELNDGINEMICANQRVAVVSVDYRLAPEHPYPAALDDCEAAALWLLANAGREFGSERLLFGGESAGVHFAATTLLRVRDRHHAAARFIGANLVFGAYDLGRLPSQRGVGAGADILTPEELAFSLDLFTPGRDAEARRDPAISPLYAELTGLPPALFTVGTADHLLDDTLLLAARWSIAGNPAELLVYPGAPHGCMGLPSVAAHWLPRLLDFIGRCVGS